MADLLTAAAAQIKYASNELASGDTAKAQTHLDKAAGFIARAAEADSSAPAAAGDVSLSSDRNVAIHQLLAQTGHPTVLDESGASIGSDPLAVLNDASVEQAEALTVLGYFGGPPNVSGVDPEPWERYYEVKEATGLDDSGQPTGGGITLREGYDTGDAVWAHYLQSKGS